MGTGRADVVKAASEAYQRGDYRTAEQLYARALNTPAQAESARLAAALDGFAGFRDILALAVLGQDDRARQQLQEMQRRDAGAPFTRLAAEFWDQYGMTGSPAAACNAVRGNVASQAGAALSELAAAGLQVSADAVCSVPR